MEIIPRLALSMGIWNANATEYYVPLRQDVSFHDGTKFNATAVKWNFDRLQWLIDNNDSQIAEIYKPLNNELLINETVIIDEFTVKFKLNYAYVPLVPILCFSGSYMLSPASTPKHEYIMAGVDTLVGTGPFIYDYSTTEETHFLRNDDYFRGAAAIPEMNWLLYGDDVARQEALLAGTLDAVDGIMASYFAQYFENEHVVVTTKRRGTIIGYFGMNNVFLYVPVFQHAHRDTFTNMPRNPMGKLYFYPVTWCGIINPNVPQIPEQTVTINTTNTNTTSPSGAIPGYPMIFITGFCLIGLVFLKRKLK